VDYKATVNPALLVDRYPLPKIDDLIVRLGESRLFSKIDLSQAYNQIVLDESSICTVINTHRGLFRYNRLVFGLASSPGIFQRIMCSVLGGIPNVEVFLDDVVIGGKDVSEHLQALEVVFSRLRRNGLKLKSSKCVFLVNEIKYLGYVLSKDGVKTDPDKVEAITKIPRPGNVTELRSFLGLINFFAKFVGQMSGRLVPLYKLLKKDVEWRWSNECEQAFEDIKRILSSAPVLAYYDPERPLTLTCDASARGVGGVLSQPNLSGRGERPVAYVSRTLTDAEKNYSQIHREALAIIFCVNKFHQYLYGRHFTLKTDHKPLVSIFGPHTGIPTMAASRMERWALILASYTFTIEYVRTDENGADGLSRLPVFQNGKTYPTAPEQTYLHFIQQALLLDYNEVCRQTARDPLVARVLRFIRDGWPRDCDIEGLQPFYNRKDELYEELGCVMWGHRLVIPEMCKERVLRMLHEPHMGIVKSKALARSYVWWPGVDEAVERMCRECAVCAAHADAPPRQAPSMWPWPDRQWSRIHLDFMGPILGKSYLVVVDAMSKWVEVFHMPSTTAGAVIAALCELFSRWGLPKQIVSDNGPPFSSTELRNYCQGLSIEHIFSAPYHPASNGLAEVTVKALKRVIKKAIHEKQDINKALWTYLLYYRNTTHSTTGQSPAMLLQGRRLRTKLDALKPDTASRVNKAQQQQRLAAGGAHRELNRSDDVWYRQYLKGEKWAPGQIVNRTGSGDYTVRGLDGCLLHRHVEQIRRRSSSTQSLAYPASGALEPEVRTNLSGIRVHEPNVEPSEATQGSPAVQPIEAASSAAVEPQGSHTPSPPGSPVFQDALPSVSPPAQVRPFRQCRLRGISRLNL
jgi:transposase InsO family protein